MHNSNSFNFSWAFKDCFDKNGYSFDDVSKNGYLRPSKLKVFWNKGYGVITSVFDAINKILLHDSNYIVNVVMWPKFGNSSNFVREVIITSILYESD